MTSAACSV